MTDKKQPLVSIPNTQLNTSLVAKPLGSNPGLRRMTDDALAWFRKKEIAAATQRFRIGEYELCAPDYRQILHWAAQYAKSPEEVIAVLERSSYEILWRPNAPVIDFRVENGKITSLVWDFSEFIPPVADTWLVEKELSIASLGFTGRSTNLPSTLPKTVKRLGCSRLGLKALDLSPVPGLAVLYCGFNELTELDLSPVPGLTKLNCEVNELTGLDLSLVPELTELWCEWNALTELDLSPVPGLKVLDCGLNRLNDLDLSPVPGLKWLKCDNNQLTDLDLSPVPGLTALGCHDNQLTELDLSPVPGLTKLDCYSNQLTDLDFSPVPGLTFLDCSFNKLSKLNIRPLRKLGWLEIDENVQLIGTPPAACRVVHK